MEQPTRLRAPVRRARVRHPDDVFPTTAFVEIVKEAGGWFLYSVGQDGSGAGDTWHMSCEDAKRQAEREFGIKDEDWEVISD